MSKTVTRHDIIVVVIEINSIIVWVTCDLSIYWQIEDMEYYHS